VTTTLCLGILIAPTFTGRNYQALNLSVNQFLEFAFPAVSWPGDQEES